MKFWNKFNILELCKCWTSKKDTERYNYICINIREMKISPMGLFKFKQFRSQQENILHS